METNPNCSDEELGKKTRDDSQTLTDLTDEESGSHCSSGSAPVPPSRRNATVCPTFDRVIASSTNEGPGYYVTPGKHRRPDPPGRPLSILAMLALASYVELCMQPSPWCLGSYAWALATLCLAIRARCRILGNTSWALSCRTPLQRGVWLANIAFVLVGADLVCQLFWAMAWLIP